MKKILVVLLILLFPLKVKAISASSYIVMEMNTNKILESKNMHNVRSVASISKIMTAIIAIESGKLDDTVIVDEIVNKAYGSGIYIKPGEEIKLRDLVYGLMLRSGNDAALMIAKYVSNDVDSFVLKMNEKAKEIGMKNTTFNNPSGLDNEKGNYSTSYDMAILTSYAMKNSEYKKIVGTKKYKFTTNMNSYVFKNKNKLLHNYKYATGGKTGFTEKARRTLVTTASNNNMDIVVVTLNDGNDFKDHLDLYEKYFKIYKGYNILKKGNINITDEKYYKNNDLYIKNDFTYPLLETEKNNIILKFELEKKKEYKDGDVVGKVIVSLGKEKLYEDDVYVNIEKKKKNLWDKIKDWFSNLW